MEIEREREDAPGREKAFHKLAPIVIATTTRILNELRFRELSLSELQTAVELAASSVGADEELKKIFAGHLPGLCCALAENGSESLMKAAYTESTQLYEIWTEGRHSLVEDITSYEARKKEYLFWIDRDSRIRESPVDPRCRLGKMAIKLLTYLAGNLGGRVSPAEVLKTVWHENLNGNELTQDRKNKIEFQLSVLQKFCGGRLRRYLYPRKFEEGVGLRKSFAGKYFIYRRAR